MEMIKSPIWLVSKLDIRITDGVRKSFFISFTRDLEMGISIFLIVRDGSKDGRVELSEIKGMSSDYGFVVAANHSFHSLPRAWLRLSRRV